MSIMKTNGKIRAQQSAEEYCQDSLAGAFKIGKQLQKESGQKLSAKNAIKQYKYLQEHENKQDPEFCSKQLKPQLRQVDYQFEKVNSQVRTDFHFNNNFRQNRLKMKSIKKNIPQDGKDRNENKQNMQIEDDAKLRRSYKPHQVLELQEFNRVKQIQTKYGKKQQGNNVNSANNNYNNNNKVMNFNFEKGRTHIDLAANQQSSIDQSQVILLTGRNSQALATNKVTNQQPPISNFVLKLKEQIKGTRQVRCKNGRSQQKSQKDSENFYVVQQKSQSSLLQNTAKFKPYQYSGQIFNQNITTMLQNFHKSKQNSANNSQNTSRIQSAQQVRQFVQKVGVVNDRIQGRIGLLQNKLRELQFMKKKIKKQNADKIFQQSINKKSLEQIKRRFEQQSRRQRQEIMNRIKGQEAIKTQQKEGNRNIVQSVLFEDSHHSQNSHRRNQNQLEKQPEDLTENINIPQAFFKKSTAHEQLIGKYKGSKFPRQFTVLVNRIRDQVEMDSEFTKIILSMERTKHQKVKAYLIEKYPEIERFFLQINPLEVDPLVSQIYQKYPFQSTQALSEWIYKLYSKIEKHFGAKLYHKFDLSTVEILIEELENNYQNSLTVGHLASYLNMRTGCQFRNRHMIKLLKRIKCDQFLERQKMRAFFGKTKLQAIKE